jgi:ribosomal protein L37E
MANTASNIDDQSEFWRPPLETRHEAVPTVQTESCARCGSEFVAGSHFCHVCGAKRNPQVVARSFQWARFLDVHRMQERLGLPLVSVLALFVGVICALAAVGTGLIYTATTVLDWQAVQIWRVEWLLAAIVAFLAGILLRSPGSAKRDP